MFNMKSRIMLMKASSICMLFSLTCLLGGDQFGAAAAQGKAKPAPSPRASVTINSGFDISDDGSGTYVDGQSGVAAQIFTAGSYDMTLDLRQGSRPRSFNVSAECLDGCDSNRIYSSGYYITIRQIGNMQEDETKWTRAHVYVEPQIKGTTVFSWCGDLNFTPPAGVTLLQTTNSCSYSDYLVSATCNAYDSSKGCTDWTVSTVDDRDPEGLHVAPNSGLSQSISRTMNLLGLYRTSFQLHVQR